MTSRINFITGFALLVVALTLAITITTRREDTARHDQTAGLPPRAADPARSPAVSDPSFPRTASSNGAAARPLAEDAFDVSVDAAHPDRAELAVLAERVERHARERLATLTQELDLTVDQQRRIFPKLVQASQSYHPAMTIAGAPLSSELPGPIDVELDPLQVDQRIQHSMDDLLLWQAIIAQLERRLASETPQPDLRPAVPASVPDSGGGRNLFDLVPAE
jgi:hypothetical protein